MNSHWSNLYDSFKDRRYGGLFVFSILAFIGLLVLGAAIGLFNQQIFFPYLLPGIGLLAAAWIWRGLRRARVERKKRLQHSPLSRDELRAARSKLRNGMKPINRPAQQSLDTFLKY
jgi:uncharacterized protein (DUF58 family)